MNICGKGRLLVRNVPLWVKLKRIANGGWVENTPFIRQIGNESLRAKYFVRRSAAK
jgi:hypothetical protein